MDGTDALQEAIVQHLRATLPGVSIPSLEPGDDLSVVDFVDDKIRYPYVVVGETLVADWDTKDSNGTEQTPTIEVFTRYRGRRQARQIAGAIYELLHLADLAVAGQQLVLLRFDSMDLERAPDGLTHVARIRYRAFLDAQT